MQKQNATLAVWRGGEARAKERKRRRRQNVSEKQRLKSFKISTYYIGYTFTTDVIGTKRAITLVNTSQLT